MPVSEIEKFCRNPEALRGLVGEAYKRTLEASGDLLNEKFGRAEFFWSFMQKLGLELHPDFFKDFTLDRGFQLMDARGHLVYFSPNIAKFLKFPIDHVLQTPFENLFRRDPAISEMITERFIHGLQTGDVTDLARIPKHTVQQIGYEQFDYSVEFIKAYPAHFRDGVLYGFVIASNVSMDPEIDRV